MVAWTSAQLYYGESDRLSPDQIIAILQRQEQCERCEGAGYCDCGGYGKPDPVREELAKLFGL